MKEEKIRIANLKCMGCATSIQLKLGAIKGVNEVEVLVDEDAVRVVYDEPQRPAIINTLHDMGYPEATAENGLLLQIKSVASCMIGRVENMKK